MANQQYYRNYQKEATRMPIYEYRCRECQSEMTLWFKSFEQAQAEVVTCTACGSQQVTRLISRVAVIQSSHSDAGSPTATSGAAPSGEDPRALARAMREASGGRDMGSEFNEVAKRLEKGESATSVEASLRKRAGQGGAQAH